MRGETWAAAVRGETWIAAACRFDLRGWRVCSRLGRYFLKVEVCLSRDRETHAR